jgi:hypothetical protein
MDILEGKNLARNLFQRYSANSRNWRFMVSVSQVNGNFFDAIVGNSNEAWQLKIDSIYKPNPLIIGTQVDVDRSKFNEENNSVPFGYRRIDPAILNKVLTKMDQQDGTSSLNSYLSSIMSSIEPEIPTANNNYAYGPFVFTKNNPVTVDEYQKNISDKLANSLRTKLKSLYSAYG